MIIPGILTSSNLFNSGSGKSPPTSVHFLVSQQPGCLHLPEDIFTSPFSSVAANILQFCARGNQPDHREGRYNSFLSSRPASQVGVIIGMPHVTWICFVFFFTSQCLGLWTPASTVASQVLEIWSLWRFMWYEVSTLFSSPVESAIRHIWKN